MLERRFFYISYGLQEEFAPKIKRLIFFKKNIFLHLRIDWLDVSTEGYLKAMRRNNDLFQLTPDSMSKIQNILSWLKEKPATCSNWPPIQFQKPKTSCPGWEKNLLLVPKSPRQATASKAEGMTSIRRRYPRVHVHWRRTPRLGLRNVDAAFWSA